jgi:hypothetical protein
MIAGVLVVIGLAALLVLVIVRPGGIFASSGKPVQGTFVSKHLRLVWELVGSWKYAEDRNAEESVPGGWKRKSSVLFIGESAHVFQAQIVVVVFEGEKPATDEDARQLGANETVGAVQRRRCEDTSIRGQIPAVRCYVLAVRPGERVGMIETYFALEGRAIFFRFSYVLAPTAQRDDNAEEQGRLFEMQLAQAVLDAETLLETLRPLPK